MENKVYVLMAKSKPGPKLASLLNIGECIWVYGVYESYDRAWSVKEALNDEYPTETHWIETHDLVKHN